MQIGKLRHYISLQNYVSVKNSIGEVSKLWTTYATVWADIKPVTSKLEEQGQQETHEITHSITIRYNGTINYKDRIYFNNEYFEVVEVINYDLKKTYQIVKAKVIYPVDSTDTEIDSSGHTAELVNYVTEEAGYTFLDTDEWIIYTRNSTTYTGTNLQDCWISSSVDIGSAGGSGVSGTSGSSGTSGASGISGTSGSSGTSGASGISGTSGSSGTSGASGTSGSSGVSGTSGSSGLTGISGTSGSSGVSGFSSVNVFTDSNYVDGYDISYESPASGKIIPSSSSLQSEHSVSGIELFRISKYNKAGQNISAWINLFPTFRIIVSDLSTYALYDIDSITEESSYFDLVVTYISGSEALTYNVDYYISIVGKDGASGTSGSSGTSGIGGGETGTSGSSGTSGTSGSSGVSGTSGTSGSSGTRGTSGSSGSSGTSGSSGISGVSGTSGSSGISGTSGSSGLTGASGTSGSSGTSGASGTSGSSGISGTSGSSGLTGASGTSGSSGISGTSGSSGLTGASGTSGSSGSSGTSGAGGAFSFIYDNAVTKTKLDTQDTIEETGITIDDNNNLILKSGWRLIFNG